MMTQLPAVEKDPEPPVLPIDRIPVRNVWLLMLYASEFYQLPLSRRVKVDENPDEIPHLVAELLTHAVTWRLRRKLTTGYRTQKANLTRVRGRIDLLKTESHHLLRRGQVACSYEELTLDTPGNRYVRAALSRLARIVVDDKLSRLCGNLAAILEQNGVGRDYMIGTHVHQPPSTFLGRLGAEDRQMLAAARLAFDLSIPTEDPGNVYIASPNREGGHQIRRLFERAVGGFYKVVLSQQGWEVRRGKWFDFPVQRKTRGLGPFLPSMQIDIELERKGPINDLIVIDTKFTSILKPRWSPKDDKQADRLRSNYIYQIYTYIRTREQNADPKTLNSAAVLLHPSAGLHFDEAAIIQGHEFRFLTVDLAADSKTIREQLQHVVCPRLTKGK